MSQKQSLQGFQRTVKIHLIRTYELSEFFHREGFFDTIFSLASQNLGESGIKFTSGLLDAAPVGFYLV